MHGMQGMSLPCMSFWKSIVDVEMDIDLWTKDKREEAKSLLEESFARQAAGTFDMTFFQEIMPKFYAIVKPEVLEEVKEAMEHFA